MFPTPQYNYGYSPGEYYSMNPQQIIQQPPQQVMQQSPQQITQQQPLNQLPMQQIPQSNHQMTPTHQLTYPMASNYPQLYQQSNQHQTLQSTSKCYSNVNDSEEDNEEITVTEMDTANKQPWQTIKKRKRSKISPDTTQVRNPFVFKTQNRFEKLTQPSEKETPSNNTDETATNEENKTGEHKPPPIFIYGVTNYKQMIEYLTSAVEEEQYYCKSLANGTIKINVITTESYRRLIKLLQQDNIVHHTYQIREERAYRVVIRNLHPSIPMETIKQEIAKYGHSVRNVSNIRHRSSKEPLPLHYVDLEPKDNNKSIYNLDFICNTIITVEAPRKKNIIAQCTRCQNYGHTKTYCTRPFMCVKCGKDHNTTQCKKKPNTPAKCGLCGGAHPANYRGCDIYIYIYKLEEL